MTPTPTQLRWMHAIEDYYQRDHWYPSYRHLMSALGMKSTNAVADMVCRLEKYGWAETHPGPWSCGIRLTEQGRQALNERHPLTR